MAAGRSDYIPGLSGRIAALRRERGMSMRELGQRLGGQPNDPGRIVREMETEVHSPTAPKIVALAQVFGVSTDFLLGVTPPCGCNERRGAMGGRKAVV